LTGIDGSVIRSAARSEIDESFAAGSASENDRASAAGSATTTSARAAATNHTNTAARSESDGASAARSAPETASLMKLFPFLVPLLQVRRLFFGRYLEELMHFRISLVIKGLFVDLDHSPALIRGKFRVDFTDLLTFLFPSQVRIFEDGSAFPCYFPEIGEEKAVGDAAQHQQPRRTAQGKKNSLPLGGTTVQQIVADAEQQEHKEKAFAPG
jgi:hypothetical protein